jgi:hypothetical protein
VPPAAPAPAPSLPDLNFDDLVAWVPAWQARLLPLTSNEPPPRVPLASLAAPSGQDVANWQQAWQQLGASGAEIWDELTATEALDIFVADSCV